MSRYLLTFLDTGINDIYKLLHILTYIPYLDCEKLSTKTFFLVVYAFVVVKACFSILKRITPYSFVTQTKIIMAYFSIHNFFQQVSVANRLFSKYDTGQQLKSESDKNIQGSTTNNFVAASNQESMLYFRDYIANQLYQVFN